MKNTIKNAIKYVLLIITILLICNYSVKYSLYRFGGTDLETRKFNMLISGAKRINPDSELAYALQWYGNWDNMFLTDKFKSKFKNRKGILPNIDELKNISSYIEREYISNEELIGICGEVKRNLFELFDRNYTDITRNYYYKYKVDENGYLDDVELVGYQDFDAETGFPIEVDESEYRTIS